MTTKSSNPISQRFRSLLRKCSKGNNCIKSKSGLLVPLRETLWHISNIKELALGDGGLKVALFFIQNPNEDWDHTKDAHDFFSHLPAVDFFNMAHAETLHQLKHSKFIGYASVLVIIHRNSLHDGVVKAMDSNEYLRYKSKVIMCRYHLKIITSLNTLSKSRPLSKDQLNEKISGIKAIFQNLGTFIKSGTQNAFQLHDQHLSIDLEEAQNDYRYFKSLTVDNFIFVQWCTHDDNCDYFFYALILYSVLINVIRPLEPALQEGCQGAGCAVTATTSADQYVYSINPALAIIINNNYFRCASEVREGSEQDVIHLVRELKIARIPYILIEDCSRADLLKVLQYLATKDLRPIKSLLVFLMSHGDEDDIIRTYDGELNIKEDLVRPIQSNVYLKDAKLHIAINACRGDIDPEDALFEELEMVKPTDGGYLAKNTIVLYSVPDRVQSLRSPETGCPFVQSFCQHFRHIKHTDDIRMLEEKINADPNVVELYPGFEKPAELVMGNVDDLHNIIQSPENFFQMIQLLKSIDSDFPIKDSSGQHYRGVGASSLVCRALNADKVPKHKFLEKYLAPELDGDNFSIMNSNEY